MKAYKLTLLSLPIMFFMMPHFSYGAVIGQSAYAPSGNIQPAQIVSAVTTSTPTPSAPSQSATKQSLPGLQNAHLPQPALPNLANENDIQKQITHATKNLTSEQIAQVNALAHSIAQQSQPPTPAPVNSTPVVMPIEKPSLPNKREAAFDLLLDQALPLSPEQIKELRRLYDIAEEAKFTTPKPPPTPISSSTRVNLAPGSTPPLIRLSAGFVSSLNFIDTTGAPWPIASYGIGDPQAFNIQWDQRSNTLFIQSLRIYAHGNLAVKLKDLDTPIMISLVSGQKEVDFRVDLQVAGRGPQAVAPILPDTVTVIGPAQINSALINFLDGIPPNGSIKLEAGMKGEAWLYENKIYFRTKLKLLSPAWSATVSSPDGTHVYEMMKTPLILATDNGKTINIELKGL